MDMMERRLNGKHHQFFQKSMIFIEAKVFELIDIKMVDMLRLQFMENPVQNQPMEEMVELVVWVCLILDFN